jgi:hypothetical protein
MAFKALFIAHAPDADYEQHNNTIDTGKYRLFTYVVKSQEEAVKVSKNIYQTEKIDAILLCPGFTHSNVSEIFQALEGKVSVSGTINNYVFLSSVPDSEVARLLSYLLYNQ